MEQAFSPLLLIPQQEAEKHTGSHAAAVAPVVNAWHNQTEDEDRYGPRTHLTIDGPSIRTTPALAIIQGGTDQTAYGSGGPDGEAYASEV